MSEAKTCRVCGETKPVDDFPRRRDSPDGYRNDCRECNIAKQAAYYQSKDAEARSAARKQKYLRERDAVVRARREFRKRDGERINARRRERHAANPEHNRALARERHRRNPEITRVQNATRKFRKRQVKWEVLLKRDDGICGLCGRPVDPDNFHIDHIVPIKHGGSHDLTNLQLAHPRCNQRKNTKLITSPLLFW